MSALRSCLLFKLLQFLEPVHFLCVCLIVLLLHLLHETSANAVRDDQDENSAENRAADDPSLLESPLISNVFGLAVVIFIEITLIFWLAITVILYRL